MTQAHTKASARAHFVQMMGWITAAAVVTTVGALLFTAWTIDLTPAIVAAVIGGVFISVVLGSGLFAAAFFSDQSGHDDTVTNATRSLRDPTPDEIAACVERGYCPRCR